MRFPTRLPPSGPIQSRRWAESAGKPERGRQPPPGILYTAYSYSRELRPYFLDTDTFAVPFAAPGQAYTLVPQSSPMSFASIGAPVVWPPFPARVAAAPDIAYYAPRPVTAVNSEEYAADMLAIAATNIATAMEKIAGYTPQEARAFAANYITYRWNGWTKTSKPVGAGSVDVFNLTNGPSFIDDQGICIRATTSTGALFMRKIMAACGTIAVPGVATQSLSRIRRPAIHHRNGRHRSQGNRWQPAHHRIRDGIVQPVRCRAGPE